MGARASTSASWPTTSQDYFRPNFFANTPDILTEQLQHGGRAAFESRLVLAATLSPTYGIYSGYEWVEQRAVRPGSEEYLDSEKYEAKAAHAQRRRRCSGSSACSTRRAAPTPRCSTCPTSRSWTPRTTGSSPTSSSAEHDIDPGGRVPRSAVAAGGVGAACPATSGCRQAFQVQDLLDGRRYDWHVGGNYVALVARRPPAHLFRVVNA